MRSTGATNLRTQDASVGETRHRNSRLTSICKWTKPSSLRPLCFTSSCRCGWPPVSPIIFATGPAHIERTSGYKESLLHLLMFAEIAIPLLAALFFEINALVILLMIAGFIAHEVTSLWDVSYAIDKREVTPIEQHVHSFLEMLPLMSVIIVIILHWPQFLALFGAGPETARFTLSVEARAVAVDLRERLPGRGSRLRGAALRRRARQGFARQAQAPIVAAMKVLVLGGTGLIGSAITARLVSRGDDVVVASRHPQKGPLRHVAVDLARAGEAFWRPHLSGVDAVVNCAGVLQDAPGDSTSAIHHTGIDNLFKACEALRIRKVIHFSAMGVDRATPSSFSATKLAGDEALMQRDLDWVILRPSVVIGRSAYGASALMRGLAALPIRPVMPSAERLQVVWLDDVVATVEYFLSKDTVKQVIELAGPEKYTFDEVVALLRAWMRWPPARTFRMPAPLAKLAYVLGDAVSLLGWRPPVRSTAQREMVRGAMARSAAALQMPITPTNVRDALMREPASVQERWFARMYFVKPLMLAIIVLFWLSTAFVSLGPGWDYGIGLMAEGGVEGTPATLTVIAGALADLCIGLAIAYRPHQPDRPLLSDRDLVHLRHHRHHSGPSPLGRSARTDAEDLADHRPSYCRPCHPRGPLMTYFILKYLHIVGAAVLLGTGSGIAFFMLVAQIQGKPAIIAGVARIVVIADFVFTATAVVAQPITGLLLVWNVGYSITDGWIMWSIVLYIVTGLFWLPVVWMQMRLRDLAAGAVERNEPLPEALLPDIHVVVRVRRAGIRSCCDHLLADDRKAADRFLLLNLSEISADRM